MPSRYEYDLGTGETRTVELTAEEIAAGEAIKAEEQILEDAAELERLRLANLKGDALAVELLDKLSTATNTQISDYVDNKVTDLASARTMLKRILLVLALLTRTP